MNDLLSFIGKHPILGFLIICSIYYTIKHVTFTLPNRIIRHMTIREAGWPPPHVDASRI
jgi:hypothetical protein